MPSVLKIIFTNRGAAFRSKMLELSNKKMWIEAKHSFFTTAKEMELVRALRKEWREA